MLVNTTKMGQRREPLRGEILATGSYSEVLKALARAIATNPRPEFPYVHFQAGDVVLANGSLWGEDETVRDVADELCPTIGLPPQ